MKTILQLPVLSLLIICLYIPASAQNQEKADTTTARAEIEFPPLDVLIDSAIKHNAMVRYHSQDIEAKESNLVSQRTYWLRNLGLQADTRYGTFDNFNSNSSGQSTTLQSVTSRQFNYGVGFYVKLPIYDVLNRKTQLKQAKAELEQAKSLALAQQDEIRQLLIRQYQEVLLKQKLLSIKSQNLGSAIVNMEMVEKQFRNGVIPIAEYVRLSDMTSRIQTDYEMARSEFMVSKKILEEIAGFTFKNPGLQEKK